jgi:putative sterol carrier protein
MTELHTLLRARFDGAHAGDLDATIEFNWGDGRTLVGIHHGEVTYYADTADDAAAPGPELVIFFRDLKQAMDIISGQGNPIEAFMQGELRSNGHIVWVFQTLAAFSKQTELPGLSGD